MARHTARDIAVTVLLLQIYARLGRLVPAATRCHVAGCCPQRRSGMHEHRASCGSATVALNARVLCSAAVLCLGLVRGFFRPLQPNFTAHQIPKQHGSALSSFLSLPLQRFTYRGPNLSLLLGAGRPPRLAVISVPGLPENRPGLVTGARLCVATMLRAAVRCFACAAWLHRLKGW